MVPPILWGLKIEKAQPGMNPEMRYGLW